MTPKKSENSEAYLCAYLFVLYFLIIFKFDLLSNKVETTETNHNLIFLTEMHLNRSKYPDTLILS